ncbi:hypothetical protein PSTG_16396 [Puccinia striiformis f. sp. tritici PST-78]|uniref:Uncharacterized protein n=1 Tax=Puccinia striiformis f. sp. tritici PST-78 TaxID=1165861 RepID=A0A0L0USV6_9BASI|nr:hypothetical protein PSTG_16396 [Puccinia striiformis f. sp. tritici PST-78]
MVKEDHGNEQDGVIGFLAFGKYFLNYNNERTREFALLAGVENSSLLTRYHSLMGTWRQVKDYTDVSGSGGLFSALVKFGLSQPLWNALLDMHGDNPAAVAHGQGDIEDDLVDLYNDSMSESSDAESIGYLPDDPLPMDASPHADMAPAFVPRRSRRGRHPDDGLTTEELARDPQSSPPPDSNPSSHPSGAFSGRFAGEAHPFRMANPPSPTGASLRSILPADSADSAPQMNSHGSEDTINAGPDPGHPSHSCSIELNCAGQAKCSPTNRTNCESHNPSSSWLHGRLSKEGRFHWISNVDDDAQVNRAGQLVDD